MITYKSCEECGATAKGSAKRCPNCENYFYKVHSEQEMRERNRRLIDKVDSLKFTLKEVGEEFDVGRERVRQIYNKYSGRNYSDVVAIKKRRRERKKQKKHAEKMKNLKYNCSACGKPVTYGEAGAKRELCNKCHIIRTEEGRNPHKEFECKNCGDSFHPYSNIDAPSQRNTGDYCSMDCYWDHSRKHGITPAGNFSYWSQHDPAEIFGRLFKEGAFLGEDMHIYFTRRIFKEAFSYSPEGAYSAIRGMIDKGLVEKEESVSPRRFGEHPNAAVYRLKTKEVQKL